MDRSSGSNPVSALFDPEEIMKEVRAAANLSPPAKTANLLKSAEAGASDFSRLAALAASQDPAKAFEAEKISPQVGIAQTDNHGVRPAKLPENEPNFSRLATLAAPPVPASFFDHRCAACGQPARFGYDVRLLHGEEGRWFCAARHHSPETRAKRRPATDEAVLAARLSSVLSALAADFEREIF